MRAPTKDEQLEAWKNLAFRLNFHRTVSMDEAAVQGILSKIDLWVTAHDHFNGKRTDKEVSKTIIEAFWKQLWVGEIPEKLKKSKV